MSLVVEKTCREYAGVSANLRGSILPGMGNNAPNSEHDAKQLGILFTWSVCQRCRWFSFAPIPSDA